MPHVSVMVLLVLDAMQCAIHHKSSPKSSYSVFLFLNAFYAVNILLSCFKGKFTDNNKEKLTFRLT